MEEVKKIVDDLFHKNGIYYSSSLDKSGQSFDYSNQNSFKVDYFSINYVKYYNEIVFGNSVVFFTYFLTVNNILSKIIAEDFFNTKEMTVARFPNLEINHNLTFGISKKVIGIKNGELIIKKNEIVNEVEKIIEFLADSAFPFFSRVSSLQVVNDEIIDKVPQMELGKYVPGQYMNLKKLIIMKLCNNPNYDQFKNWLSNIYQPMIKENPEKYMPKYNLIQKTIEYLDSGLYKELV
jgi:hypothetical protein